MLILGGRFARREGGGVLGMGVMLWVCDMVGFFFGISGNLYGFALQFSN